MRQCILCQRVAIGQSLSGVLSHHMCLWVPQEAGLGVWTEIAETPNFGPCELPRDPKHVIIPLALGWGLARGFRPPLLPASWRGLGTLGGGKWLSSWPVLILRRKTKK